MKAVSIEILSVQVLCCYVGDRKVDMKTAVSTFSVACHMNMAKDHMYM